MRVLLALLLAAVVSACGADVISKKAQDEGEAIADMVVQSTPDQSLEIWYIGCDQGAAGTATRTGDEEYARDVRDACKIKVAQIAKDRGVD